LDQSSCHLDLLVWRFKITLFKNPRSNKRFWSRIILILIRPTLKVQSPAKRRLTLHLHNLIIDYKILEVTELQKRRYGAHKSPISKGKNFA
jgi:hypothetical protein